MKKSKGVELIMDLKRANGTLMPYDASTMAGVVEDVQMISGELDTISTNNADSSLDSMETVCKAIIHHEKLCAVTYLYRCKKQLVCMHPFGCLFSTVLFFVFCLGWNEWT